MQVNFSEDGYIIGSWATEEGRVKDEIQHQVTLSGFIMSRSKISVGQYHKFYAVTCKFIPQGRSTLK